MRELVDRVAPGRPLIALTAGPMYAEGGARTALRVPSADLDGVWHAPKLIRGLVFGASPRSEARPTFRRKLLYAELLQRSPRSGSEWRKYAKTAVFRPFLVVFDPGSELYLFICR